MVFWQAERIGVEVAEELITTLATRGGNIELRAVAATDIGAVRAVNEDSVYTRAPIFFVADGMGGHHYGDRASQAIGAAFDELLPSSEPSTPAEILAVIDSANDRIQDLITEADGPGAVAGTTLTGVALVEVATGDGTEILPHWMIFNVGDSRVYSWNGREVVQITVDHSAVQELVALGVITPEEALVHPDRNVITRAVGSDTFVDTDLWLMPVQGHQVFIICSDGLTKELEDEQISATIRHHIENTHDKDTLAQALVADALRHGGRDNVSVVVVESTVVAPEGVEAPPSAPAEPGA
jgi:serine/threonine protein phosphatase PrpC